MHVVRLLAPALDHEDHSKDIDFSASGIRRRREAGYRDTMETLDKAPWRAPVDDLEGFILHEASGGRMVETAAARERGDTARASNP
jgi:NTE family protein